MEANHKVNISCHKLPFIASEEKTFDFSELTDIKLEWASALFSMTQTEFSLTGSGDWKDRHSSLLINR